MQPQAYFELNVWFLIQAEEKLGRPGREFILTGAAANRPWVPLVEKDDCVLKG
jgi:hypothetical protein